MAGFSEAHRLSMLKAWGDKATNGGEAVTGLFSLSAADHDGELNDQMATFEARETDVSLWVVGDAILIDSTREGKSRAEYTIREKEVGHRFAVFLLEDTS